MQHGVTKDSVQLHPLYKRNRAEALKSAPQMKLNPSAAEADFIPAGDFIIEDDFSHPKGWI